VIDGTAAKQLLIPPSGPASCPSASAAHSRIRSFNHPAGENLHRREQRQLDGSAATTAAFAQAGAFALAPGSKDAALVVRLPPGGLHRHCLRRRQHHRHRAVEIYDLDPDLPFRESRRKSRHATPSPASGRFFSNMGKLASLRAGLHRTCRSGRWFFGTVPEMRAGGCGGHGSGARYRGGCFSSSNDPPMTLNHQPMRSRAHLGHLAGISRAAQRLTGNGSLCLPRS